MAAQIGYGQGTVMREGAVAGRMADDRLDADPAGRAIAFEAAVQGEGCAAGQERARLCRSGGRAAGASLPVPKAEMRVV